VAIKVMIVDDSNFMRKAISSLLTSDNRIEVTSLVGSGEEALRMINSVNPDVITLDFNLTGMNGLETLEKIMDVKPTPVIMFSGYTKKGADITLKALNAGAIDFVAKPHGCLSLDLSAVRDELIEKVLASVLAKVKMRKKKVEIKVSPEEKKVVKLSNPEASILFIASSTGGVQALGKVVPLLPASLPMPVVVVQHMPPLFTESLATSLDSMSPLKVKEAEDNDVLTAGKVFIAPGGWHLKVFQSGKEKKVTLDKEPVGSTLKPCADVSMATIASIYKGNSLCVILTGMGDDGTKGASLIKNAGGRILAQDEATSTIYGMPRSVIEAGFADAVLPLDKISNHIINLL